MKPLTRSDYSVLMDKTEAVIAAAEEEVAQITRFTIVLSSHTHASL